MVNWGYLYLSIHLSIDATLVVDVMSVSSLSIVGGMGSASPLARARQGANRARRLARSDLNSSANPLHHMQNKLSAYFAPKPKRGHDEPNETALALAKRLRPANGSSGAAAEPAVSTALVATGPNSVAPTTSAPVRTDPEPTPSSKTTDDSIGGVAAALGLSALSPLERQVVQLKAEAGSSLLLVMVGYKWMAFGEDARTLATVLHVCAFAKQHMLVAGFPLTRLPVHLQRLLCAGHRVALAEQVEGAAEKAAGDSPHSTFERRITAVHTYSTFVPDADASASEASGSSSSVSIGGSGGPACCLLAVDEVALAGGGGVRLSLLAVDVRAGAVFIEELDEAGPSRAALRSRLEALAPVHLLLPATPATSGTSGTASRSGRPSSAATATATLSAPTRTALDEYVALYAQLPQPAGGCAAVRVETLSTAHFSADAAVDTLTTPVGTPAIANAAVAAAAAGGGGSGGSDGALASPPPLAPDALPSLLALPAGVLRCVGAACLPLGRCGLLALLGAPASYQPLAAGGAGARLVLGSTALHDLHVLRCIDAGSSDARAHGMGGDHGAHSLLNLIDRTATPPGARLLRQWLAAPLRHAHDIQRRQDAVAELHASLEGASSGAAGGAAGAAGAAAVAARGGIGRALLGGGGAGGAAARAAAPRGLAGVVAAVARCGDVEAHVARVRSGSARPAQCLLLVGGMRRVLEAMQAAMASTGGEGDGSSRGGSGEGGEAGGATWSAMDEAPRSSLLREWLHPEPPLLARLQAWERLLQPAARGEALEALLLDAKVIDQLRHLGIIGVREGEGEGEGGRGNGCGDGDSDAVGGRWLSLGMARLHAAQRALLAVEAELKEELRHARRTLHLPTLEWKQVGSGGEEYFVEVARGSPALPLVPADWTRVGQTKTAVRFRPAAVEASLLGKLRLVRERRHAAARVAWARLLACLRATDADALGALARRVARLDCLQSLARLAASPGWCRPRILPDDAPPTLRIRNGRHPLIEARLRLGGFVANDTGLGGAGDGDGDGDGGGGGSSDGGGGLMVPAPPPPPPRGLVLMGPNMGGKSSYARQVAVIALLAQLGSYVPADACALTPFEAVHTRFGARDQLALGRSSFFCEMAEAAEALRAAEASPRVLLLLDELGRGTSTHDGAAVSHAALQHIAQSSGALCVFVTHHPAVAALADAHPALRLMHMASVGGSGGGGESGGGERGGEPLYRLADGAGPGAFALRVGALAGVPAPLLDAAAAQAERLRAQQRRRHDEARLLAAATALLRARTVVEAEVAVAELRR